MVGRVLGGRYAIQERIGGGGMATVYRALDTYLNRRVAVKVLRPQLVGDEEFVRRFRREARAAASLSHPHIVAVHDVGQESDETYYIVMEFVDGETLKDRIRREAPLPPRESVRIADEMLDALEAAHASGVIHRDVKPQNVLLTRLGAVKVTDFGIARATTAMTLVDTVDLVGTAHYVSPEQASGQRVDARGDIYSAGVVLYEMLTGRVPFDGEAPVAVALQHVRDDPVRPRTLNPRVPPQLDDAVARAMAKDPARRYPSAAAFRADLDRTLAGGQVAAAVPDGKADGGPGTPGPGQPPERNETSAQRHRGSPGRRPWRRAAVTVGLVVVVGSAALLTGMYALQRWVAGNPTVRVPDVRGRSVVAAQRLLTAEGLSSQVTALLHSSSVPVNDVITTTPPPGSAVKAGREIELTESSGPQMVSGGVPDVTGLGARDAEVALENAGLDWKLSNTYDPTVPKGSVVSTQPSAGTPLPESSSVTLVVSKGPRPKPFTIPNGWVGQTESQVEAAIAAQSLVLGTVTHQLSGYPAGFVVGTNPQAGSVIQTGDQVGLTVSSGCQYSLLQPIRVDPTAQPPVVVTVTLFDSLGERVVYQGVRQPGDTFPVRFCWAGPQAHYQVEANGRLAGTGVLP